MGSGLRVMTPTKLRLTDRSTKWGLVTVSRAEGGIEREHLVDACEANRVAFSVRGWPECVTQDEWESGRAHSATYSVWPGQACMLDDGSLVACLKLLDRGPCVDATVISVPAGEWRAVGDAVAVSGKLASLIRKSGF